MPPIVAAIVGAIGLTGIAATIASTVIYIGLSVALAAITTLLIPRPRSIDQGRELGLKLDATYPREIVLGRAATGGSLAFAATSGTNNRYLWRVIALSDFPVSRLVELRLDGQLLPVGIKDQVPFQVPAGGPTGIGASVVFACDGPAQHTIDVTWTANGIGSTSRTVTISKEPTDG